MPPGVYAKPLKRLFSLPTKSKQAYDKKYSAFKNDKKSVEFPKKRCSSKSEVADASGHQYDNAKYYQNQFNNTIKLLLM